MNANLNLTEFAGDFAIKHLGPVLTDLSCSNFEFDGFITWFYKASRDWTADSQTNFNAVAVDRIRAHVIFSRKHSDATTILDKLDKLEITPDAVLDAVRLVTKWEPCQHWGGSHLCEKCKNPPRPESMAQAQDMYDAHRKFVLSRLRAELRPYLNGQRRHPDFDDLEQKMWHAVARKIDAYVDQRHPCAWLRTIVHGTVIDHFKHQFAQKRDIRKTTTLDDTMTLDPVPAKPSPTADQMNETKINISELNI